MSYSGRYGIFSLVGWGVRFVRPPGTDIDGYPSKYFSVLQSYCSRLLVGILSYDSRLTLIWIQEIFLVEQLANYHICLLRFIFIPPKKSLALFSAQCHYSTFLLDLFFCDPVVLESICNRTKANRLINERTSKKLDGIKGYLLRLCLIGLPHKMSVS